MIAILLYFGILILIDAVFPFLLAILLGRKNDVIYQGKLEEKNGTLNTIT